MNSAAAAVADLAGAYVTSWAMLPGACFQIDLLAPRGGAAHAERLHLIGAGVATTRWRLEAQRDKFALAVAAAELKPEAASQMLRLDFAAGGKMEIAARRWDIVRRQA